MKLLSIDHVPGQQIERLEKEGRSFMDVSKKDVHRKKATGAALGAGIIIALNLPVLIGILWANGQDPLPKGLLALILAVPVIVIVCVMAVLIQRIKEIKGGEEDEANQYSIRSAAKGRGSGVVRGSRGE